MPMKTLAIEPGPEPWKMIKLGKPRYSGVYIMLTSVAIWGGAMVAERKIQNLVWGKMRKEERGKNKIAW